MFIVSGLKKIKNTTRDLFDDLVLAVLKRHLMRQKSKRNFLQTSIISLVRKDDEMKVFCEHGAKYFDNRPDFQAFCASLARKDKHTDMWLEFGVYQGESLRWFAKFAQGIPLIGFDCFEGLPESIKEIHKKGDFKVDAIPVFKEKNIELRIGYFKDTLPKFLEEHSGKYFSLIHIDSDLYSSAKFCLDDLARRQAIFSGQIIVFDDWYGYAGFEEGEYKAWHEFSKSHSIHYSWIAYTEQQVALIVQ